MLAVDSEAVVCDLAETYHVYDMRSIPSRTLATLAAGLKPESRIMMRVSGMQATRMEILLAVIADGINNLVWFKTKDARHGRNRPARILDEILGRKRAADPVVGFESAEDFEEARRRILMEVK